MSYGIDGARFLAAADNLSEAWDLAAEHAEVIKKWKLVGKWGVRVEPWKGSYVILAVPGK